MGGVVPRSGRNLDRIVSTRLLPTAAGSLPGSPAGILGQFSDEHVVLGPQTPFGIQLGTGDEAEVGKEAGGDLTSLQLFHVLPVVVEAADHHLQRLVGSLFEGGAVGHHLLSADLQLVLGNGRRQTLLGRGQGRFQLGQSQIFEVGGWGLVVTSDEGGRSVVLDLVEGRGPPGVAEAGLLVGIVVLIMIGNGSVGIVRFTGLGTWRSLGLVRDDDACELCCGRLRGLE